jgi:hypothetical protein
VAIATPVGTVKARWMSWYPAGSIREVYAPDAMIVATSEGERKLNRLVFNEQGQLMENE